VYLFAVLLLIAKSFVSRKIRKFPVLLESCKKIFIGTLFALFIHLDQAVLDISRTGKLTFQKKITGEKLWKGLY